MTQTVADKLRNARCTAGATLDDIAEDICVKPAYLAAIEQGNYSALPERAFAVGFIRAYAKAVGEDAAELVKAFKKEAGYSDDAAEVQIRQDLIERAPSAKRKSWLSPLFGLTGAVFAWLVFAGSGTETATEAQRDRQDLDRLQSRSDGAVSLFPAAYAVGEAPGDALFELQLSASADSWVRLSRQDGTEIWSGVLGAGESFTPHLEEAVLLSTTNAGGLEAAVDGLPVDIPRRQGAIVTDLLIGVAEDTAALPDAE